MKSLEIWTVISGMNWPPRLMGAMNVILVLHEQKYSTGATTELLEENNYSLVSLQAEGNLVGHSLNLFGKRMYL